MRFDLCKQLFQAALLRQRAVGKFLTALDPNDNRLFKDAVTDGIGLKIFFSIVTTLRDFSMFSYLTLQSGVM